MLTVFHSAVYISDWFVFWYFVFLNAIYTLLIAIAAREMLRYANERKIQHMVSLPPEFMKPYSVLVPAFNEEISIIESVKALLNLDYPEYEVIVCNDGSTDGTMAVLKEAFRLEKVDVEKEDRFPCGHIKDVYYSRAYARLMVIDKENGGKSDALNAAASFGRYPYVCAVDADSLLSEDSMGKLMQRFVAVPGSIAVGGVVRLSNGAVLKDSRITQLKMPRNMTERIQIVEYFRAFLFGRVGLAKMNVLMIISGAFGVFRQDVLSMIGGWDRKAIGEDMELVVRLQKFIDRHKQKIVFAPEPVCWTQAPRTLGMLSIQRDRWQRALLQCLIKHAGMLFNPRYGMIGLIGFPYYFFFELLGAVIEFLGYPLVIGSFILGIINLKFFLLFMGIAILWGLCISVTALVLAELSYRRYPGRVALWQLIQAAFYENFGYRQLHSFWRFKGMVRYLFFGRKTEWGQRLRQGFDETYEQETKHEQL